VYALYNGVAALFGAPRLPLSRHLLLGAGGLVLIMIAVVPVFLWKARELRRLLEQPDIVAAYRQWLQATLRRGRLMKWPVLWFVGIGTLRALAGYGHLAEGRRSGGVELVFGLFTVVGIIFAMILHRRAMRRTARELAELH
jgi:hypothetical protein